jgi:hypothetical protein
MRMAQTFRRMTYDKDLAITDFIETRMPAGRKRKGVPKHLMHDAKTKFGLKSKSAVLRALNRGRTLKKFESPSWVAARLKHFWASFR